MAKAKGNIDPDTGEELVDVIVAFDPADMSRNGKPDKLPASRAALLVNEGRVRYADPDSAPPSNLVVTPAAESAKG